MDPCVVLIHDVVGHVQTFEAMLSQQHVDCVNVDVEVVSESADFILVSKCPSNFVPCTFEGTGATLDSKRGIEMLYFCQKFLKRIPAAQSCVLDRVDLGRC